MKPENVRGVPLVTGLFAQAEIRGEYIYAHRADECGKFTYKFHWTDPKNPVPEILEGWR